MTKSEFFYKLGEGLGAFPEKEINEYIDFYAEMIEDRIEDGLTEEEAVADVGTPDDIINRIIAETPLPKLVKTKLKRGNPLRTWEIVLLAIGSPIWLSILIAVFAVIISLFAAIFSVVISLYAVTVSFAACGVAGILGTLPIFILQNPFSAFTVLGLGLFCVGVSILLFFGCNAVAKLSAKLVRRFPLWIKSLFVIKESAK